MTTQTINHFAASQSVPSSPGWLKRYYFSRFAFSVAWVLIAFSVARNVPALAAIMLVGYPAWDAIANFMDAQRSGGLARNKSQMLNFVFSILTAIAVAVALDSSMSSVLIVFGIWAGFSGIFQLATAVGRWKTNGAQWAMILSGAQSVLAGAFMIKMAQGPEPVGIANIAPYAAFGAFYFAVSAISLVIADARKNRLHTSR
jgi:uncharacterized membrane protein HdeD (DUF308 family)